jgi:hypothetical protein
MPFTPIHSPKRQRVKLRQYRIPASTISSLPSALSPPPPTSAYSFSPILPERIGSNSTTSTSSYSPSSNASSPSPSPTPRAEVIDERDLLCRGNMKLFIDLMTSMGFVDHFTSDTGGKISMTSVKLYISRLQHFMLFCRRNNATTSMTATPTDYEVMDIEGFLDLWNLILRRLPVWLPSYTKDLTNRENLAPDTVRNIVNQFKAIIRWYLLFASELREQRLDIHTANMLLAQSDSMCQQITRQFNKATKKRRAATGKDLMEFKVRDSIANE